LKGIEKNIAVHINVWINRQHPHTLTSKNEKVLILHKHGKHIIEELASAWLYLACWSIATHSSGTLSTLEKLAITATFAATDW